MSVGREQMEKVHLPNMDIEPEHMLTLRARLQELQRAAGRCSAVHGFNGKSVMELIALMHSELSEAVEEYREGRAVDEVYYKDDGKPEGVPVELADVVIRILAMADELRIPVIEAIIEKHAYNLSRPYKHGKKRG